MSKSFKYLPKSFPHFKAQKPGRLSKAVYSSLNGESFEALCEKSKNRNNGIKKKLFRYNPYILCSAILTVLLPHLDGTAEGLSLQLAVLTMNKWWFAIAFAGIGIGTCVKDLWQGAMKSGVLKLYMVTNLLDILIALGLAYAVF